MTIGAGCRIRDLVALATPLHLTRSRRRGVAGAQRVMAAVLGVLVVLIGPAWTHHHVAVQAHAVCEHGAEIHVDAPGAPAPADPGGVTAVRAGGEAPDDAHEGEHHHCAATAGVAAVAPAQVSAAVATLVPAELAPPRAATVTRATALFRLAPKTSPPV